MESMSAIEINASYSSRLIDLILGAVNSPRSRISTVVYNGLRGQLTRVLISSLIQLAVTDLF